jgi:regulator of protease activity HflC (stomatin/prohibitin superfamily)
MIFMLSVIVVLFLLCLKQINEWQRGVIYTMGRFTKIIGPG